MRSPWYVLLLVLMFASGAIAQQHFPQEGRERPGRERLNQFRKMRLIEALNLNEEDAVRFFAKQTAHEGTIHDLMNSRGDAMDDLKKAVQKKGNTTDIQKSVDLVLDTDQKIFAERQRYQAELRKFLTPEEFAKFLMFEQNFGRQMRDALEEMHRGEREHDKE